MQNLGSKSFWAFPYVSERPPKLFLLTPTYNWQRQHSKACKTETTMQLTSSREMLEVRGPSEPWLLGWGSVCGPFSALSACFTSRFMLRHGHSNQWRRESECEEGRGGEREKSLSNGSRGIRLFELSFQLLSLDNQPVVISSPQSSKLQLRKVVLFAATNATSASLHHTK